MDKGLEIWKQIKKRLSIKAFYSTVTCSQSIWAFIDAVSGSPGVVDELFHTNST